MRQRTESSLFIDEFSPTIYLVVGFNVPAELIEPSRKIRPVVLSAKKKYSSSVANLLQRSIDHYMFVVFILFWVDPVSRGTDVYVAAAMHPCENGLRDRLHRLNCHRLSVLKGCPKILLLLKACCHLFIASSLLSN